jgi:hypothetical protein
MNAFATTDNIAKLEGDIKGIELKIDLIVNATEHSSLDDIFGDQTVLIITKLDKLDSAQANKFEKLQQSYTREAISLEDVRREM